MSSSISCPVCQNLCSSMAVSCPKCGHPFINDTVVKSDYSNVNSFTCPKCGSDQTSTFEMAYSQGASSGRVSAGTVTAEGNLAFTGGKVNTQSVLAKQIAPPSKPIMKLSVFFGLFVAAGLVSYVAAIIFALANLFFITFLVVMLGGYYTYYQHIQREIPKYFIEMRSWSKGKICFRCGNKWFAAVENANP
jgi:hypothetical protein